MISQTVPVPGDRLHVLDEGDPTGTTIMLLLAGIADLPARWTRPRSPRRRVTS